MKRFDPGLGLALCLGGLLPACHTTISAHRITDESMRTGGLPFYLPKPVISIKQPVEVGRAESLHAVLLIGGLQHFLLPIDVNDFDGAVARLKALLAADPKRPVTFVPAERVLTVKTEQSTVTATPDKPTTTVTEKYTLVPAPPASEVDTSPFYAVQDGTKAFEVLLLPDTSQAYELTIDPAWFASTKISVTFQDGWRFTALNSETGENQLVKEVAALATSLLGIKKDIEVAGIGADKEIALAKLEQESNAPGTYELIPRLVPEQPIEVSVRVLGYMKRVELEVVRPGLYIPTDDLIANGFRTESVAYWRRVSF